MGQALRLLLVEDSVEDAHLLIREIGRGGYQATFERVDTLDALRRALETQWDVIIADYYMPELNPIQVLGLLRELDRDLPMLIVSGSVGEAKAVEVMRAGARDFIAKDSLGRLVPAIEREVVEARARADRKSMQQQLALSDRMASLGVIAAGIGHEVNNPLAAVCANVTFALRRVEAASGESLPASELLEPLRDAQEAASRMQSIVQDLKVFSRSDDAALATLSVRAVMESSVRMASNQLRYRAQVVRSYAEGVPPVEAYVGKLGQVFLNLIINAAQAIPEGEPEKHQIRLSTRIDRRGDVVGEVSDTGAGIPPDVLPRIFESFFTTKPSGVGTGLGLAISRRIVTELGGRIEVESVLGKGSTFRVTLPPAKQVERAAPPPRAGPVGGPRSRVLIVDDEPILGKALQRLLLPHHDVTVLTSAREAMALLGGGTRYDVIVSDLMMPDMSGMEFYDAVVALAPEQAARMVFATGGTFSPRAREFLMRVQNPRLEKPFDFDRLLEVVQQVGGRAAA